VPKAPEQMGLREVLEEQGEIRPKLQQAFREAGDTFDMSKVTAFGEGDDRQKSTQLAEMNLRYEALGARRKVLEDNQTQKERLEQDSARDEQLRGGRPPVATDDPPGKGPAGKYRDLASVAMEKKDGWYRGVDNGPTVALPISAKEYLDYEIKTVMSTGAGFAPESLRSGLNVPAAFQMPAVIDLIPVVRTNQQAYVFMRQTTRTNSAAEIAESTNGSLQSAAESAFAWTQITETLRKINHFVPVTDEQLKFVEGMEDLLRQDMRSGVRERLSSQILNGDGSAPNIEGFYDAGRDSNQVDATAMNLATALAEAIEDCQVTGFANPDAHVVHPTDWWKWKRTTTNDGIFINGHPAEQGPQTSWGLPVVLTTESAAGSALTGAFQQYSRLAVFGDVEVQMSSEHASYFIQGVKAIKAEIYATLAVLRETAFTEVTNLA